MRTSNTLLSCTLALLLLASLASAASVTRNLSPATVAPGEVMTVTLSVDVSGAANYYAIDDIYPSGWAVVDAGSGSVEHAGHWKEVVIEGASNTVYTYTLRAPSSEGTYAFSGEYMFGGMESTAPIGGLDTVECKDNVCMVQGANLGLPVVWIAGIAVLIIAALAFLNKDKIIKK